MALSLSVPSASTRPPYLQLSTAEADLVNQLRQGNEAAFRQLVAQYQNRVYRIALSLVRSSTEAEDIAQEVFVEVYQTIGNFRGEAALGTWLYRLATPRALRHQRWANAKKRIAHVTNLLGLTNEVLHDPPDHAHPQALLEGEQQVQQLLDHIGRLPTQQRLAFLLRHEHELSYEEIAAVLATSVAAVESLLFRARQTLRHSLRATFRHV